jgi:hypothetical protein
MDAFRIIAENKINSAFLDGEFDNLPGEGKPIHLGTQQSSIDEHFLANHILKNNGFLPDWLEERKLLLEEISAFQNKLILSGHFLETSYVTIIQLNRKISEYNLRVPVTAMQLNLIPLQK